MDENERVYFLFGNQRSADDCFSEGSGCGENTGIMGGQSFKGGILFFSQFAIEGDGYVLPGPAFVNDACVNMICLHPIQYFFCTSARKCKIIALVLGAADDSRNIPDRHAHSLIPVILRIAEGSDAFDLILCAVGEVLNWDVYSVCKRYFCRRRKILWTNLRLLSLPGFIILLFIL